MSEKDKVRDLRAEIEEWKERALSAESRLDEIFSALRAHRECAEWRADRSVGVVAIPHEEVRAAVLSVSDRVAALKSTPIVCADCGDRDC